MDRTELREQIRQIVLDAYHVSFVDVRPESQVAGDLQNNIADPILALFEPLVRATRSLALGEACLIAAQVATLAERMQSPFKEGMEMACEEILARLMGAGASHVVDLATLRPLGE